MTVSVYALLIIFPSARVRCITDTEHGMFVVMAAAVDIPQLVFPTARSRFDRAGTALQQWRWMPLPLACSLYSSGIFAEH